MDNIRYIQITWEKLYAISFPLNDFLASRLVKVFGNNNWFERGVKQPLVEPLKKLKSKSDVEKYNSLEDLDISELIKVLIVNWENFSNLEPNFKFTKQNKQLVIKIKSIRNKIAHYKNRDNLKREEYNEALEEFANFLGTDLRTCLIDVRKTEKEKIFRIIRKKVLQPAIQSNKLDEETLDGVKNTFERLDSLRTSEEVIAFFNDALKSSRGKKIYENLHKANLLGFEDIKTEVINTYFSN